MIKTLYFKVKLISLFLQLNLGLKTRTKISISRKTQEIRENIKLEKRPLTTQNNSTSTHKEHLCIANFCKYNDYFDDDANIFCMMMRIYFAWWCEYILHDVFQKYEFVCAYISCKETKNSALQCDSLLLFFKLHKLLLMAASILVVMISLLGWVRYKHSFLH